MAVAGGPAGSAALLGVPRLLLAFGAGLCFAVALAACTVLVVWRPFLGIHLVHAYLFMAAPVLGALVACGRPRRPTPAARASAACGALALLAVGLYSSWIEPFTLRVETATVPLAPGRAGRDELLVGVLADTQCERVTGREREAVARVMAARPDLILPPGDLRQPGTGAFRAILSDLRVTLAGVELNTGSGTSRALLERLSAPGGDDVRLLLAHRPDWVLELPHGGRADLVVAGHTHGGPVRLPLLGPPITLIRVPRAVAGGGLHVVAGTPLYVSRGLGHEHGAAPRVRSLCPP